jgi:hypothetical protein
MDKGVAYLTAILVFLTSGIFITEIIDRSGVQIFFILIGSALMAVIAYLLALKIKE